MDKIRQYFGRPEYPTKEEYEEREQHDWESAKLVDGSRQESIWEGEHSIYATKLSVRDNPEMSFYSFVRFHNGRTPHVDIPLYNPKGTKQNLVEKFYTSATFFGEIDREKFETLATNEYRLDDIMTYLNQTVASASNEQTPEWFYDVFGVEHLKREGDVYIGSHGGMGSFNATIETSDYSRWSDKPMDLNEFADKINKAYPHLTFEPLSKDDYLEAIEKALPFQPKDWNV